MSHAPIIIIVLIKIICIFSVTKNAKEQKDVQQIYQLYVFLFLSFHQQQPTSHLLQFEDYSSFFKPYGHLPSELPQKTLELGFIGLGPGITQQHHSQHHAPFRCWPKPPFSYIALITMAITSKPGNFYINHHDQLPAHQLVLQQMP